jgi:hypothetical protein
MTRVTNVMILYGHISRDVMATPSDDGANNSSNYFYGFNLLLLRLLCISIYRFLGFTGI